MQHACVLDFFWVIVYISHSEKEELLYMDMIKFFFLYKKHTMC